MLTARVRGLLSERRRAAGDSGSPRRPSAKVADYGHGRHLAFTVNVDPPMVVLTLPRVICGLFHHRITGLWTLNAHVRASTVFQLPADDAPIRSAEITDWLRSLLLVVGIDWMRLGPGGHRAGALAAGTRTGGGVRIGNGDAAFCGRFPIP